MSVGCIIPGIEPCNNSLTRLPRIARFQVSDPLLLLWVEWRLDSSRLHNRYTCVFKSPKQLTDQNFTTYPNSQVFLIVWHSLFIFYGLVRKPLIKTSKEYCVRASDFTLTALSRSSSSGPSTSATSTSDTSTGGTIILRHSGASLWCHNYFTIRSYFCKGYV